MPEDNDPGVMAIEAHEDFLEHVERGGSKIRSLSRVTVPVASLLTISYLLQLVVFPFLLGVRAQTVDLVDPTLMAFEAGLLALTLAWLYVGVRDYRFATKLAKQIREIRELQDQKERKITGT